MGTLRRAGWEEGWLSMRDLHVLTVAENGTRLLLADASGEQFSLPLDERLKSSLRAERAREQRSAPTSSETLSPREIQAQVRAGASPDEVASMAGISLERVLRFAAPVVDERAHMARRARGVLLRNESMLELGTLDEVASKALVGRGVADTVVWDAWRREDGRWIVSCGWFENNVAHVARWVLDASAGSATPMDDDARALAGLPKQTERSVAARGQARLAVVPNPQGAEAEDDATEPADAAGSAGSIEDETPTGEIPVVTQAAPSSGADGGSAGSPGPAHPARRARRQRHHEDDAERLPLSELTDNIEVEETRASAPRSVPDTGGRQRPAVPSWDEIMFGRRT
jgi:hypothetical protein